MSNYAKTPNTMPLGITHQIAWERAYQKLLIKYLKKHKTFDGSAVAAWMRLNGLHDPVHHNMWGVQIQHYAKLGWFKPVGRGIPTGAAHISQVRIWESTYP